MPELHTQPGDEWHRLTVDETLLRLESDLDEGLTAAEAQARMARYGPNRITTHKGIGPIRRALAQISQPLVVILVIAGAITAALQQWVDSGVIFGVVVINAIVGYIQEAKAVKAIEALSQSMTAEATVVRDGRRLHLSAVNLVRGDVVILQAGDKIPADLRLTFCRDLRLDESTLTGESLPVEKRSAPLPDETGLADRSNMAYASTLVTAGRGAGLVVTTGDDTEVGRISHLIAHAQELKTPLTRKIAQLSRLLLLVILGLALVTAVVGVLHGEKLVDMFLAAVALAVAAIPEGLPAAVTITLAIGVSRMARRRAIIRKLPAVETLGGTTVICSDKTGTLTENQMTVQRVATRGGEYSVTGGGYAPYGSIATVEGEVIHETTQATTRPILVPGSVDCEAAPPLGASLEAVLRAGLLCNDSSLYQEAGRWHIHGDPTEGALLVSAAKAGLNREYVDHCYPRLDTIPFESEHQYMATLHRMGDGVGGGCIAFVKGAVEKVVTRSAVELREDGSTVPIEPVRLENAAREMAAQGLRVLAFAQKEFPADTTEITRSQVKDGLVFLGLQSMLDPPRQEALEAVAACHNAGIQVKMITGDHALTAMAIGRRLNLGKPGCAFADEVKAVTGIELAALADDTIAETIENTYVFARVTPEQKLRLVNVLQSQGHVVAMTGDGVNDAPALRQADIGVAMGITGTEVAKEAADMILTDDNFASIEAAVEEGRGVFDNLTKFITWTLPTNVGEGLVVLAAIFAGVALPITPVQILWINMTTAVLLGLMLAFEPKEEGIMQRPPRSPQAPLLGRDLMGRIVLVGALLLAAAFGLFEYFERVENLLPEARTVAVNVFVFGEMSYLFNCRSLTLPSWRMSLRNNHFLFAGVGLMIALQLLYTYVPNMNRLFGSAQLGWSHWVWILGAALGIHVIVEVEKGARRWWARRHPPAQAC